MRVLEGRILFLECHGDPLLPNVHTHTHFILTVSILRHTHTHICHPNRSQSAFCFVDCPACVCVCACVNRVIHQMTTNNCACHSPRIQQMHAHTLKKPHMHAHAKCCHDNKGLTGLAVFGVAEPHSAGGRFLLALTENQNRKI